MYRGPKRLYDWRCECGNFKCRFVGEPELNANCYCQSCLSCAQYCDRRGGKENVGSDGLCVESVYFAWRQIYFSDFDAAEKLEYIKVGDDGKNFRSCTTCKPHASSFFNNRGLQVAALCFRRREASIRRRQSSQ